MLSLIFILCISLVVSEPNIFFNEEFLTDESLNRWIQSTHNGENQGVFRLGHGKHFLNETKDSGLKTTEDARFYGISYKLAKPIDVKNKPLVIQYQVKHDQNIDCGGGYIKIIQKEFDQTKFHGDTPYQIMFGPDVCGNVVNKVHMIIHYKGQNKELKKDVQSKEDDKSHLYTLILNTNNTYQILIDNEEVQTGSLEEDFEFLGPKTIKDPNVSKPADWEDNEFIPDPDDKKPDTWDQSKTIPDPNATKPIDWDDEMDGEWEAPKIDNPDFKGEWQPKNIKNPKYKGEWIHPEIPNPDFKPDKMLYYQGELNYVGFDIWQVKSGSIFDNILITDDPAYAKKYSELTWEKTFEEEKRLKALEDEEEKKREEEQKKQEEEEKKKEEEEKKKEDEKNKKSSKSDDTSEAEVPDKKDDSKETELPPTDSSVPLEKSKDKDKHTEL